MSLEQQMAQQYKAFAKQKEEQDALAEVESFTSPAEPRDCLHCPAFDTMPFEQLAVCS